VARNGAIYFTDPQGNVVPDQTDLTYAGVYRVSPDLGQQPAVPVVGFLIVGDNTNIRVAFLQGPEESGFVEGQNVAIEYRSEEGQFDQLPALAADLVRRRVSVIVARGVLAALGAKAATATIRPGGNQDLYRPWSLSRYRRSRGGKLRCQSADFEMDQSRGRGPLRHHGAGALWLQALSVTLLRA
jgi:hypothetical protein